MKIKGLFIWVFIALSSITYASDDVIIHNTFAKVGENAPDSVVNQYISSQEGQTSSLDSCTKEDMYSWIFEDGELVEDNLPCLKKTPPLQEKNTQSTQGEDNEK